MKTARTEAMKVQGNIRGRDVALLVDRVGSQAEAGRILGVSRERIRQLLTKAAR